MAAGGADTDALGVHAPSMTPVARSDATTGSQVSTAVTQLRPRSGSQRRAKKPASGVRRAARRRPRTAFVFSGGASLGALQVGMVRALFERGITADLLVGTSVGALNAAFIASRPQTPATARQLTRAWYEIKRADAFPLSLRTVVGGLAGSRDHLVPARGLRQIVERHIQLRCLTDAPIPLHLVAFDIKSGRETLLSEGRACDAVMASCSIPGIFPPVAIGDQLLIDGGVVNNTPISHAVELGAERIYVLPTQGQSPAHPNPQRTAIEVAMYGISLLVGSRLQGDIARYGGGVELIVLPVANSRQVQPTDFSHSIRLLKESHAACREALVRVDTLAAAA